jgi:hypothetical protein
MSRVLLRLRLKYKVTHQLPPTEATHHSQAHLHRLYKIGTIVAAYPISVRKAGEAKGYLKGAASADVLAKQFAVQIKPTSIIRLPDRTVYITLILLLHLYVFSCTSSCVVLLWVV